MSAPPDDEAERAVLEAVRLGWVAIVGQDEKGRNVYRLTESGRARAEEILGGLELFWTDEC